MLSDVLFEALGEMKECRSQYPDDYGDPDLVVALDTLMADMAAMMEYLDSRGGQGPRSWQGPPLRGVLLPLREGRPRPNAEPDAGEAA